MRTTTILTTAVLVAFGSACSISATSDTEGSGGGATGASTSSTSTGVCPSYSSWERIPLSLLNGTECATDALGQPLSGVIEGTFTQSTGVPGGFAVSHGAETIEISGVSPAIPTGTFVRISYGCYGGYYGDAGAFVMIENIPSLDGAPNPTEPGTRLWYFVEAGGENASPAELPFVIKHSFFCADSGGNCSAGMGSGRPMAITLSMDGASATAKPTEKVPFSVPSGDHAGAYALHNVSVSSIVFPGCDSASEWNFEITRAD